MRFIGKLLSLSLTLGICSVGYAKGPKVDSKGDLNSRNNDPVLAAGCSPAQALIQLSFNNVNCRVETGGLMHQNRAEGIASYEVPKNSGSHAVYSAGLWCGGTDVNGQLKLAAAKFGQGVDWYTGPLRLNDAEIDEQTCRDFDRFYPMTRQEVRTFVAFQAAVENGTSAAEFPGYSIPQTIMEWPGNGIIDPNQELILAPFVDVDNNMIYEPESGDYPFYDLIGNVDCRAPRGQNENPVRPLFGDQTYWWVYNDRGNLHTETNAPSIGMEVQAQAFAFATNDEVNDMTFYNYKLINRSTFTLTDTYFASWVDVDLGDAADDFVGCDVNRGLGYAYNGDNLDENANGVIGYGTTPASLGVDFFEGPYQDADGINNLVGTGPGQALNGLGYQNPNEPDTTEIDQIIDNERFGMRRFVYHNIGNASNGDPQLAIHYYNYMRGIWRNGQPMFHGGNGLNSAGVETGIRTAFMFPGDTDTLHWGTTDENGVTTIPDNTNWTENNPGGGEISNPPGDRRFLQSAGPFTLRPGNVNDITVGFVWAQAESGGPLASLERLFEADDKAQALFDNCFQVLNGPDAPDVEVQELDRELIFYLSNPSNSNNFQEAYEERDPNIVTPDELLQQNPPQFYDDKYRFEGYQVFQLSGSDVSISDIDDPERARLAFQCDKRNGVSTLVNFQPDQLSDDGTVVNIPQVMVEGANEGIQHSFRLTTDLFASGDNRLVNYKTYYYIAIAYGYNEFKKYVQGQAPNPDDPFAPAYDGQTTPYLASRRTSTGGSVVSFTAIPHDPATEAGGTVVNAAYGDLIPVTRLQGTGNGGQALRIGDVAIDQIFNDAAWNNDSNYVEEITYELGSGPVAVQVVDPLNVIDGKFVMKFINRTGSDTTVNDNTDYMIYVQDRPEFDTIFSETTISTENEQILETTDRTTNNIVKYGLSVKVEQVDAPGPDGSANDNGFVGASIEYANPDNAWLSGINDQDGITPYNWILSGTFSPGANDPAFNNNFRDKLGIDENQDFEGIIEGTWAPYRLVSQGIGDANGLLLNAPGYSSFTQGESKLEYLNSVMIVFTNDRSKWSRVPVIELQEEPVRAINGDEKYAIRTTPSVDMDGNPALPTDTAQTNDSTKANFISPTGMGWFPGYAINVETGERLNMAFGEDSWLGIDNGSDMIWNPTSVEARGVFNSQLVWGGKHYIYVFRKSLEEESIPLEILEMTDYDHGARLFENLSTSFLIDWAWRSCSWVGIPMLEEGEELLSTEARLTINVSRPYANKFSEISDDLYNQARPVYTFETNGFETRKNVPQTLEDNLSEIRVVPNPYYANSDYEVDQLDNRVKIINLPEQCTIKIYNMNGTLIREYSKADPLNFLDWDLKNQANIPVASGVYIIHVDVPGIGERVLKWFGVMRPIDLNTF